MSRSLENAAVFSLSLAALLLFARLSFPPYEALTRAVRDESRELRRSGRGGALYKPYEGEGRRAALDSHPERVKDLLLCVEDNARLAKALFARPGGADDAAR